MSHYIHNDLPAWCRGCSVTHPRTTLVNPAQQTRAAIGELRQSQTEVIRGRWVAQLCESICHHHRPQRAQDALGLFSTFSAQLRSSRARDAGVTISRADLTYRGHEKRCTQTVLTRQKWHIRSQSRFRDRANEEERRSEVHLTIVTQRRS